MIPALRNSTAAPHPLYSAFLAELRVRGFAGNLSDAYSDRTVLATDNSIYQMLPQAIAFPSNVDDLVRIARLAGDERFRDVKIAARGGGTGTNGQSLTEGLVVDVSRHMNRIIEINVEEKWVRVQAGVVKDQLNAALAEHGLFFPPELSTSNRATIGGMINTDASGQGSCLYGKTRDHVLALTSVLSDGTVWSSEPVEEKELSSILRRTDRVGAVHRIVNDICCDQSDTIAFHFPKLNRCLTGYDLAHIRDDRGRFNLNSILCGAEGTLCMVAEAKLNVLPIPKATMLVNIRYGSFDAALRDARSLIRFRPASIETIDSRVLALARNDIIWDDVREFFPVDGIGVAEGVNLVEFVGEDRSVVQERVRQLTQTVEFDRQRDRWGCTVAGDDHSVERIWEMRKRAVGLLGNMQGERRPIPFVEDTAVPPEKLADFIAEFRAVLDRHGLVMGCLGMWMRACCT